MIYPFNQFVDIHTHILPGLDDGPKSLDESRQLAQLYVQAGVQRIVATPHFLPGTAWSANREQVMESVETVQEHLQAEGIHLKIEGGMEIAYHKRMMDNIGNDSVLPLGSSNHYLIEPSFQGEQDGLLIMLDSLLEADKKIILAHPERIVFFQHRPQVLKSFVKKGLKVQVNGGSLLGQFGKESKKVAEALYENSCLHFVASDAHNCLKRMPLSKAEWQSLHELPYGDDLMLRCKNNSQELFG
jgi:protein-tyrosine phosphatase